MSLGNTIENELLDHILRNADIALIGDATGLRGSSAAGSLYLSLHTADPGEAGDQTTSECSYTGDSRVALARSGSPAFGAASGGTASLSASTDFGQRTDSGAAQEASYFMIGTASSSTGKQVVRGIIGPTSGGFTKPFIGIASDDGVRIVSHGLSVGDRVAFRALLGSSLPTGLTEGVVYYVKTVVDADTITLSTSSGGATLDITANGSGIAQRAQPISITQGTIPRLTTGTTVGLD